MASSKTSALLHGDGDENQSIDFSVDSKMLEKLDIRRPRRGEDFSTYEADKMYKYQLERDIKKIVEKRGHFAMKNALFLEARQTDADYAELANPKKVGEDGNFIALQNKAIPLSWMSTIRPYGEIAHKRYLEYLANLPKGPTEEEIKDKKQRQLDQELWTKIM